MLVVSALLYGFGVIDQQAFTTLVAIFGGTGLYGIRDAMK